MHFRLHVTPRRNQQQQQQQQESYRPAFSRRSSSIFDGKKVISHGKFSLRPQRPGRSAAPTIRGCVFPARSAALGPVDPESANSRRRCRVQPWTVGESQMQALWKKHSGEPSSPNVHRVWCCVSQARKL